MFCRIWKKMMILTGALLAVLSVSCRSDYSGDAVEKARSYALKNLRGITEMQREYIRFTQPQIFENMIFARYVTPLQSMGHFKVESPEDFPTAPFQDLMHSCFVWSPPDLGAYVVVMGDGDRNMFHWNPYRVLIKKYYPGDQALLSAVAASAAYAQNDMLYLSVEERNRMRFAEPESIEYTKLELKKPDAGSRKTLTPWEEYLAELEEEKKEYHQISLVWKADDPKKKIVFSGWTDSGTLKNWKLANGELMSVEKLQSHLLTKEEIAAIPKAPADVPGLVFPAEQQVKRADIGTAPDALQTGGSIIYKQ